MDHGPGLPLQGMLCCDNTEFFTPPIKWDTPYQQGFGHWVRGLWRFLGAVEEQLKYTKLVVVFFQHDALIASPSM